jgi:glycosyltransferase involved in cell wall biosynthesis
VQLNALYVLGTYPQRTTTFIDREIAARRGFGASVEILSMRRWTGPLGDEQKAIGARVRYVLPAGPAAVLAQLFYAVGSPSRYFGLLLYLLTRSHPTMTTRVRTLGHFMLGVHCAFLTRSSRIDHVHAHFVDRAATVALTISRLRDVPYSVTAHANDIYVSPVLLREKMLHAKVVVTCTNENVTSLVNIDRRALASKVRCIHHGIDLERYRSSRSAAVSVPTLLAVGQLREKKGFGHLIDACARLRKRGYSFQCQIVGDGPLREQLEAQIHALDLIWTVQLLGPMPHEQVVGRYAQASIFVLPSVRASDGAQDGIPNVILEAMAAGLPIVSTRQAGIPEALEHEVSGLLVTPGDPVALADALGRLLDEPGTRERLARQARLDVAARFDLRRNADALLRELVAP